jgi:hypothetical protein
MLYQRFKHYTVGAFVACSILIGSCVFNGDVFAQERLLRVAEVISFEWGKGHPQWKQISIRRLPNALFKVGNGRFSFDLPDMARGLYPVHGTLKKNGSGLYFVGTSEDSPGPGYGQITHIEGTLTMEGESLVASFIHSTRTYSTGYQSSYSAKIRLK